MGYLEGGCFIIMADFPDLSSLSNNSDIGEFLSLPNASYPYFWAWIIGGIWFIITLALYFKEKERKGFGNLLSSMAVSCFAVLILSLIGTIVGFISVEIMIYILVLSFVMIAVWFFSGRK